MHQPESKTFSAFTPGEGMKDYTLILSVTQENTDTCYVVYTDHSVTEEGSLCVFASIYEEDPLGPLLLPIEDDETWDFLEGLLEQITPP